MKKHNFSAGPCILPQEVLLQASESIMDFNQSGLSLIEISHRSKPFVDVIDEAKDIALDLLNLKNKGYQVFTIPTQHFDVIELSELTPERFKAEVQKQQKNIEMQNELLALAFGKRVEAGLFADLFTK